MELRHLRYFVTVAAERSFSRASEKLNIAQPPVSRQIQQLETELGVQLLHRGRPLTLTESGRYFFEQARQGVQRADAIQAMTRRSGTGQRREFGIGFVKSTPPRRVIREEKLSVCIPRGHVLSRRKGPLKLKHTAGVPLVLYPNAPRPSYADQVLSFYRDLG